MMKKIFILVLSLGIISCNNNKKVDGVYRYAWGKYRITIYGS